MQVAQRVLLAEANDSLRQQLYAALIDLGVSVDASADGVDAIDKLNNVTYAVAIIDYALPVVDGEAIIERVRLLPETQRPLMIITAQRGLRLTFDHEIVQVVMRKPFDLRHVADLIAACVRAMAELGTRRSPLPSNQSETRPC
jgi:DNA-binding response OmpR family regulator